MDISFDCKSTETRSSGTKFVSVSCEGAIESEVLVNFKVIHIIEHFGISELLDNIGQDECEKYFDLVPNGRDNNL